MSEVKSKVAIIMGSDSDLPVAEQSIEIFKRFGIDYEVHVYSAHRTPDEAISFAKNAKAQGFKVIISIAGMAAHLGGIIAANTILPVIGVPCKAKTLEGLDAMLATVQMPPGVPVATVGIDAGANAAILATEILSLNDNDLSRKLEEKRAQDRAKVLEKDKTISKEK